MAMYSAPGADRSIFVKFRSGIGKGLSPRNFPNLRCCDVSPMLASRCGYQVSLSPRAASLSTEQWRVSQNMYPLRKQCNVCQAAASTQLDRKARGVSYQRRCKPSAPATTTKRQNIKNSNCPSNTHNQTSRLSFKSIERQPQPHFEGGSLAANLRTTGKGAPTRANYSGHNQQLWQGWQDDIPKTPETLP